MCISSGPAHFSKTKILTMPKENRHFTAYQNDAENLSNQPNALILPIPGRTRPEWFVDTSSYNKFLEEIVEEYKPKSRGMTLGMKSKSLSYESFELGQYTVGLCSTLDGMKDFLNSVPDEKRAKINPELLQFFVEKYPNWSFALCLFSSTSKMKSQPIAYEYEPFSSDFIFFPTMDSHDGSAPKNEPTLMDHDLIYPGSYLSRDEDEESFFTQPVPDFLKSTGYNVVQIHNRAIEGNGDCYIYRGKFIKSFNTEIISGATV